MARILFLTAGNVPGMEPLRVSREARAVRAAIATVDRDFADLQVEADVETGEVVELVLSTKPDIIHFSGHGRPGQAQLNNQALSAATFSRIVREVPGIWCVVLNACYSYSIAKKLVADGAPAVVGMARSVSDEAAIDFSRFFYRALAEQPDVKRAVQHSQANLHAAWGNEAHVPKLLLGGADLLATRSLRHSGPEIRARFCVNDDGTPVVWAGDDDVFVAFDLYIERPPMSASSVIYRLDESYNETAKSPKDGPFHEVEGADDKFYLGPIDSEDDYTVEAFFRWNDGRSRMIKRSVTAALTAHYDSLAEGAGSGDPALERLIRKRITELENGKLVLRHGPSRGAASHPTAKQRKKKP